jgi:hypothetical protein
VNEACSVAATVTIDAEGTANDITGGATTHSDGLLREYSISIPHYWLQKGNPFSGIVLKLTRV